MQVYSVVVSDHSLAYHQLSESIWIGAIIKSWWGSRRKINYTRNLRNHLGNSIGIIYNHFNNLSSFNVSCLKVLIIIFFDRQSRKRIDFESSGSSIPGISKESKFLSILVCTHICNSDSIRITSRRRSTIDELRVCQFCFCRIGSGYSCVLKSL